LAQPDRITSHIDNSQSVVLTGRVHRLATAQNDAGPVDPSFQLPAITLTLKPSAAQQTDLNQLLAAQQDATSPSYGQWLTPEQYGSRFGVSAGDLAQITAWLESQGFTVGYTARARNFVSFSGTAQQVAGAFHTQIHTYNVNGETHYANATDPSIPAALAGLVSGIRGLNNFRLKPHLRKVQPNVTFERQSVVGPTDFANIYDVSKLYSASITGTGQGIMIVGQSEIHTSDITNFRNIFGLGAANLNLELLPTRIGGGNPGYSTGDEGESDLDIEWSGAVAKGATIYFVYSMDVWTSAQYAVDEAYAPVLSMSYGLCEQGDFADLDWQRATAQQASAEGITWLAAQGDSAAADCDEFNDDTVAEGGLSVDAPGSFPEVTSMGGTEFNDGSGTYWPSGAATGYIPEAVWNETAVSVAAGGYLLGGGGGASVFFTQPPWQNGIAPNDGMRHVPDLSSAAAVYHDPFYIYSSDSSFGSTGATTVGGTSCAAPTMAGIVAMLNQYLLSTGAIKQSGLGNINPTLYRLAQTQSSAFHDIVNGNNIVPCADSPDCVNGHLGWSAGPGYDSASGLGSVDAYNLVHSWNTALATQALVVPSLDSTPEYETAAGSNMWTFTLTLTEEAGFATTLTGLTINGSSFTQAQIQSLFSTTAIPANGQLSGTYSLRNLNVSNGPVNVVFTFSGGTGSATWSNTLTVPFTGPQPALTVTGITNAASYQQVFAPGMIVNVWGTGMGDFAQAATITPLPYYAAGVSVYIYNLNECSNDSSLCYPAPLYYVSPNQLNVQIPYELPSGEAEVAVATPWNPNGVTFDFPVVAAAPGIFSYANPGSTTSSPIGSGSARVGDEVAIYVTGVGQLSPVPGDGVTPTQGTTPVPRQSVSVTVGGVPVTNLPYVGIPSWSVGVLQINFVVPSGVPAGPQPVVVTVGSTPSLPANIAITP
jgi:uncharacterized protein (TIGR03437 family)